MKTKDAPLTVAKHEDLLRTLSRPATSGIRHRHAVRGSGEEAGKTTVRDIVAAHLRAIGADGLCREDCGCATANLFPCASCSDQCVPARRVVATEDSDFHSKGDEIFVPMAAMTENEQAVYCRERCTDALGWSDEKRCECRKTSMCNGLMTRVEARKEQEAGR